MTKEKSVKYLLYISFLYHFHYYYFSTSSKSHKYYIVQPFLRILLCIHLNYYYF